jgi:hypothetical protein
MTSILSIFLIYESEGLNGIKSSIGCIISILWAIIGAAISSE